MPYKGVVVVPPGRTSCVTGEGPSGTQRIANRPIVCHVADALRDAGVGSLVVVSPPDNTREIHRCLQEDGIATADIVCTSRNSRTHLTGALEAAVPFVGDSACIVHLADGLIGQDLQPFTELLEIGAPDVVVLLHPSATRHSHLGPAARRSLGISELDPSKSCLGLVGVCLLGPGLLRLVCAGNETGSPDFDLKEVVEEVATRGRSLQAGFARTWRRYCGNPLDLLELNRIVLDQQEPDVDLYTGDNRIEGRVIIHPTAEVSSSTIVGPTIVGAATRISGSYIGPYTSIGANAEIEGAEIERSIISDGARIMHVGGRIEASTVGPRANIFRDFALPRALRLHVGEGVEVALN